MQVKRKIETKEITCPHCKGTIKILYCGLLPGEDFTGNNVSIPCVCQTCKKHISVEDGAFIENYSSSIIMETGLMPFIELNESMASRPIKIEDGYVIYDKEV